MTQKAKGTNLTWHPGDITQQHRETIHGHKAAVLWFTGLSGSGKSTIANAVEAQLAQRKCSTYLLDGDNVRHGLNGDLDFSPEGRVENIRRISEVAKLFADAALITLTAFISPYREDRQHARDIIGPSFVEVYIKCDLRVAESRDPKGLYAKARAGEIPDFTGISAPYEEPETPELTIDTSQNSIKDSAKQIIDYLENHQFLVAR